MSFDPATFSLELGGEAGRIALAQMFWDWSRYPRRQQAEALDQAVAFVFELGPRPPYEEAKALLVPIIRGRSRLQAMLSEPSEDPEADMDGAWRPYGDHLVIHVAIDRPHSLTVVNRATLSDWARSFDEVFDVAMANLASKPPPVFEWQGGGFYLSECGDYNDIARLLVPAWFEALELDGAPVVVAGARDCVMIAGADDDQALEAMAQFAAAVVGQHSRPISYAPLILEDGEWRPFPGRPELEATRALRTLQTTHDYEQQLPFVLERLSRQGRPTTVANSTLLPTPEGVRSVALWTECPCLLPRTDLVVVRTGVGPTLLRAWDDVAAACSGLPMEPSTAPPYYVAAAWPDAAALEAALTPAWAEGIGFGVANGRLTMFG